jgi:predicted GNAT superfamily acetyltransferase
MEPIENIEIRQLSELDELAAVVKLQREIWGFNDIDLLPQKLFVVADKIGGQVLGAFDAGKLVAFCLAIPGLKAGGKYYIHSHMLGVLPEYRNSGLGRRLKLMQREWALGRDVDLIEWTFDPLQLKNAFFNIERLGVIVRRYVNNQYGATTSQLHAGLPTDRLVPEWWLRSERVAAMIAGQAFERPAAEGRIVIPANITALIQSDPTRARRIQMEVGEQFENHFRAGLAVIGFEKTDNTATYLLGPWELQ